VKATIGEIVMRLALVEQAREPVCERANVIKIIL